MKKIMIVDDSLFIFEEMKEFLNGTEFLIAGYAKSGEEALELYEEIMPDIVTMDIILPGMDGLETTRKLMQRWPDANILMVSSLAYDDTIDEARNIGAREFIYKPFCKDSLVEALEKCTEPAPMQ